MDLDATINSHPIVQPVEHPDQITEIFDAISYSKGASVLRYIYERWDHWENIPIELSSTNYNSNIIRRKTKTIESNLVYWILNFTGQFIYLGKKEKEHIDI